MEKIAFPLGKLDCKIYPDHDERVWIEINYKRMAEEVGKRKAVDHVLKASNYIISGLEKLGYEGMQDEAAVLHSLKSLFPLPAKSLVDRVFAADCKLNNTGVVKIKVNAGEVADMLQSLADTVKPIYEQFLALQSSKAR